MRNRPAQSELANEIAAVRFALIDLGLYLDTHPDDKKAFSLFRELVGKAKQLVNEYQREYGPLSAFASAESSSFDWLECPWPWEKEANR